MFNEDKEIKKKAKKNITGVSNDTIKKFSIGVNGKSMIIANLDTDTGQSNVLLTDNIIISTDPTSFDAIVEIRSDSGALLLPRLTEDAIAAMKNPVSGMLIHNLTTGTLSHCGVDASFSTIATSPNPDAVTADGIITFGDDTGSKFVGTSITIDRITNDITLPDDAKIIFADNGFKYNLSSPTIATDLTFNFPATFGNNKQFLQTDGAGNTIWANGDGSGTVTSVAITGSTGLQVTGSPITTEGTIALTLNDELQGLSSLSGVGFITRTANGTYVERSLVTDDLISITITNGDGVNGNPSIGFNPGGISVANVTTDGLSLINGSTGTLSSFTIGTNTTNLLWALPSTLGLTGQVLALQNNEGMMEWKTPLSGPVSSTNTGIAIFSQTSGNILENSLVTINPISGNMTFPTNATITLPGILSASEVLVDEINILDKMLYSTSYYVNDGINDIQDVLTEVGTSSGNTIYIGSGSYGGTDVLISGKNNLGIICPNISVGVTNAELSSGRGLTIDGTSSRIRINSLSIKGLLTFGATGNNYFTNLALAEGLTISAATTGNFHLYDCDISGPITVPSDFTGVMIFTRCNFNGAATVFNLSNASPLQVILEQCLNLSSFSIINATLGTQNTLATSLQVKTNTTILTCGEIGLGTYLTIDSSETYSINQIGKMNNTLGYYENGVKLNSIPTIQGGSADTVGLSILKGTTGVKINTTAVSTSSIISITRNVGSSSAPDIATLGSLTVGSIIDGASFTVYSSVSTDTAKFHWFIINPS